MTLLYGDGFSAADRQTFRFALNRDIISTAQEIVRAVDTLQLEFEAVTDEQISQLDDIYDLTDVHKQKMLALAKQIVDDPVTAQIMKQRHLFQFSDSSDYVTRHYARIISDGYIPTDEEKLQV